MKTIILGASFLLLLCGAANARPRDETMINAYRCAAHPGTRVWLDCYYGAAQPQRAALNLPPAPAAQLKLLDTPPTAGVAQDMAARDEVMAGAARCASIAGDRAWLDCYYAAANPVRAVLNLPLMPGSLSPPPPGPVMAMAKAPPPRPVREHNNPGWVGKMLGESDFKTTSRMASYRYRGPNFIVALENGQVWEQVDGETTPTHWKDEPASYLVTITGGAFGSYNFSIKDHPGRYKVRRAT
jgi:hypothetical protein